LSELYVHIPINFSGFFHNFQYIWANYQTARKLYFIFCNLYIQFWDRRENYEVVYPENNQEIQCIFRKLVSIV
jgi:hypothetical protein